MPGWGVAGEHIRGCGLSDQDPSPQREDPPRLSWSEGRANLAGDGAQIVQQQRRAHLLGDGQAEQQAQRLGLIEVNSAERPTGLEAQATAGPPISLDRDPHLPQQRQVAVQGARADPELVGEVSDRCVVALRQECLERIEA